MIPKIFFQKYYVIVWILTSNIGIHCVIMTTLKNAMHEEMGVMGEVNMKMSSVNTTTTYMQYRRPAIGFFLQ